MQPKQTAVVDCPKSMVGRVIGKGGETIKALQQYTGAMIQIDQSVDPTRVTIAGAPGVRDFAAVQHFDVSTDLAAQRLTLASACAGSGPGRVDGWGHRAGHVQGLCHAAPDHHQSDAGHGRVRAAAAGVRPGIWIRATLAGENRRQSSYCGYYPSVHST